MESKTPDIEAYMKAGWVAQMGCLASNALTYVSEQFDKAETRLREDGAIEVYADLGFGSPTFIPSGYGWEEGYLFKKRWE